MGQRLNLELTLSTGEVLANLYLHWDAFSCCSARDTIKVLDVIREYNSKTNYSKKDAVEILMNAFPLAKPSTKTREMIGLSTLIKDYIDFEPIYKKFDKNPETKRKIVPQLNENAFFPFRT